MRKVPEEERSTNYASHATCAVCQPNVCTVVTAVRKLLQYSNELKKVVSILARIMAAQSARDRRVTVKAMTNKRAHMKTWPILFICQATGALHLELMHNYGTKALLLQWARFTSI